MRKKILIVTDTFGILGKDLAIVEMGQAEISKKVEVGIPIIIVCPDKTEIKTKIAGIENILTVSGHRGLAFLIEGFPQENVPIGSEVFINN